MSVEVVPAQPPAVRRCSTSHRQIAAERRLPHLRGMVSYGRHAEPRVTFSDRINNGIVVGFDDGKTTFFRAARLHATLHQSQMMPSDSEDRVLPHEQEASDHHKLND